jgi:hypothetical protein
MAVALYSITHSRTRSAGHFEVAAPFTGADVEGKRDPSVFAELSYRF